MARSCPQTALAGTYASRDLEDSRRQGRIALSGPGQTCPKSACSSPENAGFCAEPWNSGLAGGEKGLQPGENRPPVAETNVSRRTPATKQKTRVLFRLSASRFGQMMAMNTHNRTPGASAHADFARLVALAEAKAQPTASEDWAEFSLSRLLADMASPTPGRSTDFVRVYDRASPDTRALFANGRGRVEVPLEAIHSRDLAAGTGSAGGYTVGASTRFHQASLPALRDLNIEVITIDRDVPGVPVATGPTFAWASSEGAAGSPTDATFALAATTPVTAVYQASVNRRFLTQGGPAAEALVRETILNGAGRTMLAGVLGGSGSSGEPTGLTAIAGTISQSGTSLAWSGLQTMVRAVADTGAADADCAFVGTPTVRELLAKREKATGSGIVWADGKIDGHPAYVTPDCPSASLLYGPWNQIKIFVWGGVNFEIMAGRFSTAGAMTVRCLIDMAVVIPRPACFAKATSVT